MIKDIDVSHNEAYLAMQSSAVYLTHCDWPTHQYKLLKLTSKGSMASSESTCLLPFPWPTILVLVSFTVSVRAEHAVCWQKHKRGCRILFPYQRKKQLGNEIIDAQMQTSYLLSGWNFFSVLFDFLFLAYSNIEKPMICLHSAQTGIRPPFVATNDVIEFVSK